jgi:hypothetical protein
MCELALLPNAVYEATADRVHAVRCALRGGLELLKRVGI